MEPGDVVGERYRLERRVGRGGMAEVFAAVDTRLDRIVAVKVIGAHLVDRERAGRHFEREVLAIAGLQHPNVVSVHDADVDLDHPYLVTELVEGGTLADRISAGPLSPTDAATIAAQVASGLGAAHARGLIHRDVKPANVLLTLDGTAKVTDFGIVQALDHTATMTTSVFGSTPYVAPELIHGKGADARTDVYALGCMLFEMLTGRPPYVGDTPAAVIGMHLQSPVPDVAALRPPALDPVPPELARLVTNCLAKDPDDRPMTMHALGASLVALGGDRPVPTPLAGLAPTLLLPQGADVLDASTVAEQEATVAMPHAQQPGTTPDTTSGASPDGRRRWMGVGAVVIAIGVLWALAPGRDDTTATSPKVDAPSPAVTPTDAPEPDVEPEPEPEPPMDAAQAIRSFRAHLDDGRDAGQLKEKEADKLAKGLDEVQKKLADDDGNEAISKASDLRKDLDAMRRSNKIDPVLADALDQDVDALLEALVRDG